MNISWDTLPYKHKLQFSSLNVHPEFKGGNIEMVAYFERHGYKTVFLLYSETKGWFMTTGSGFIANGESQFYKAAKLYTRDSQPYVHYFVAATYFKSKIRQYERFKNKIIS